GRFVQVRPLVNLFPAIDMLGNGFARLRVAQFSQPSNDRFAYLFIFRAGLHTPMRLAARYAEINLAHVAQRIGLRTLPVDILKREEEGLEQALPLAAYHLALERAQPHAHERVIDVHGREAAAEEAVL